MRVPVPTNRLVAFTLVGALLTAVVAGGLAFPGLVPGLTAESPGEATSADTDTQQLAAAAPEPNQNFTPDVQTRSDYEEHEEEGYEDHEEEEYEEDEEHEDHEEEEHEDHDEEEYED